MNHLRNSRSHLSTESAKMQNGQNPDANLLKGINQMSLLCCAVILQFETTQSSIDLQGNNVAVKQKQGLGFYPPLLHHWPHGSSHPIL